MVSTSEGPICCPFFVRVCQSSAFLRSGLSGSLSGIRFRKVVPIVLMTLLCSGVISTNLISCGPFLMLCFISFVLVVRRAFLLSFEVDIERTNKILADSVNPPKSVTVLFCSILKDSQGRP